ncbi:diguanylate cyclase [Paludibacterium sp. B53371]|uniref:GGDEF domain-containing response regulator n=1 Tax=Paludibacterium sp. B53371 TaxID=2806263 RepID=UPI001C04A412|nr:diguanylate cyclase [Paludibacterium sp. B53371]
MSGQGAEMALDTILCVDDDSSVLHALRTLLSHHLPGHVVIEIAESGEEALELVDELAREGQPLTAVVADYIMPGMKGDELLIQVHARMPGTVTIMLTGQSDMQGVKRAINEANLFRFLEKPWQNEDIVLTIQAAIRTFALDRALKQQVEELARVNQALEATVAERTDELRRKNQELEQLAVTDTLTGLYNRLFVDQVLLQASATARRSGAPLSLVMLDIDHFKLVNDHYGHQVGDQVLQQFAQILRQQVRDSDVVARWGGEEFLIVCAGTPLDGALAAAEKWRRCVEDSVFAGGGHCTASFGVASWRDGDTVSSLLSRADQALYAAKQTGRNQVQAEP